MSTGVTLRWPKELAPTRFGAMGYGRSESTNGSVFAWNFPLMGTYWDAADVLIQHIIKKEGGAAALRGKKIALLYHDSPYGKEPIPVLQDHAKRYGLELVALPVAHPGIDQRAAWLMIRQQRPDYVFLWGWGVMNSTALRHTWRSNYPARSHVWRLVGRRRARRGRGGPGRRRL
jgi:branched-chain amino acid transport system substrate-binding protein